MWKRFSLCLLLLLPSSAVADELFPVNELFMADDETEASSSDDVMVDLPPLTVPSPPPPKKKSPPTFPGPKTLPPTGPWKINFFDNDFSYKQDPDHAWLLGEELKDMPGEWMYWPVSISTGGEVRHRFMAEDNRLRPGVPLQADYNLWRWRHYVDARCGNVRIYGELLTADRFGSTAPDLPIDVNRWDLQNLFVDYKFLEDESGSHTIRYGRQELLFGRQRLVSPLDWANTRRNFQGARYLLQGESYKVDVFAVHPVNSATGYRPVNLHDNAFDQPNYDVWFSGTYFTYSGWDNTVWDLYWLYLDTGEVRSATRPGGERHLLGSRYGRLFPVDNATRVWDVDLEGGMQIGQDFGQTVLAGFYTHVLGHTWSKLPLSPRLSHTFYYGSGDAIANSGHNNTFDVLFPLNHAYWAISDNLSGQNLYDYALQVDLKPTKKTALTAAQHWFALASNGDRLYNVAGVPLGSPGFGRDVGQALDLYGYYAYNPNFDIQVGYSWFWYGEYISSQPDLARQDASQFYVQTSLRY